ncbi:hypothetical protein J2129_001181 [Methanofollis sp. W23]|uniref:hypothetical protein n=1 Tax=Methanofollis sp. W23 TaxID=2817849 RepID=UPI001AE8FC3F|nr:hypothetical protein [Methanofollis sp. W23]MBP2145727.1 hypothetical protein [Methanofollis sp. W23]
MLSFAGGRSPAQDDSDGAALRVGDHSERVSVVRISGMEDLGKEKSSYRPPRLIVRIIFMEFIPKSSKYGEEILPFSVCPYGFIPSHTAAPGALPPDPQDEEWVGKAA